MTPRTRPILVRWKQRLRGGVDTFGRFSGLLAGRERRREGALTVLTYHRVLPERTCIDAPFPDLVMPLDSFRAQVRWLARHTRVLPLREALAVGASTHRPLFALTFDDGYHDASDVVAPVLEEAGVRGTFFVTTGFVGTRDLLWFDRAALLFDAVGDRVRRTVTAEVCRTRPAAVRPPKGMRGAEWARSAKDDTPAERAALIAELERIAGPPRGADTFRALTVEQLVALHSNGHEIGSHTVDHALLPQLGDEELRLQLEGARSAIVRWTGGDAPGFCFPNGDHDDRSIDAVVRAGHRYACTTLSGTHRRGADPLRIRRIEVAARRVCDRYGRFDTTAFRSELCGLGRGYA